MIFLAEVAIHKTSTDNGNLLAEVSFLERVKNNTKDIGVFLDEMHFELA